MHRTSSASRPAIVVALAATWIIWGSTFLAIHVSMASIPPFLLMATRFLVAGSIALGVGLARAPRHQWPTRRHWSDASMIGAGMITISIGCAAWALTRLDTGVAALLAASGPLFIAMFGAAFGTRPTRTAIVGLVIGMLGVGLLVAPSGGPGAIDPFAAGLLVLSNVGWALASIYAARVSTATVLLGSGMQMLAGGALLLLVSAALGEFGRFDPSAVTGAALACWAFLVVLGSLGGFLAYGWLLEHVSTTVASTHAFVNPLVAVALGAAFLGEQVSTRTLVAGSAVIVAVVILLLGERARTTAPARVPAGAPVPVSAVERFRTTRRGAARRPIHAVSSRRPRGFSPAPTPSFARRSARPWQATDGMDALSIDDALDSQLREF